MGALYQYYSMRTEPTTADFVEGLRALWDGISDFMEDYALNAEMVEEDALTPVLAFLNAPGTVELCALVEEVLFPSKEQEPEAWDDCEACQCVLVHKDDGTVYCEVCE